MKVVFIVPHNANCTKGSIEDGKYISWFYFSNKSLAYPLAIPTLIALTPPEHEVRVVDENISAIDYNMDVDLVGISVMTGFVKRAYGIADRFQQKGVKVVLGGIHASMCPEEALEHSDAVVIGEAEHVWHKLLMDAETGKLRKTYRAESKADLTKGVMPQRRFLDWSNYLIDIVQTTKGCPFHCEFCSVYSYDGQKIRQ